MIEPVKCPCGETEGVMVRVYQAGEYGFRGRLCRAHARDMGARFVELGWVPAAKEQPGEQPK